MLSSLKSINYETIWKKVSRIKRIAQPRKNIGLSDRVLAALDYSKTHPEDINAWIRLGTAYRESEDIENAIKSWKKACEIAPESHEAKFFLLSGLWENGEKKSAQVKKLIKLLKVKPSNITVYGPKVDFAEVTKRLNQYGLVHIKKGLSAKQIKQWNDNLTTNLSCISHVKGYEDAGNLESLQISYILPSYFVLKHKDTKEFVERFKKGVEEDGNPYFPEFTILDYHYGLAEILPELRENNILEAIAAYLQSDINKLTTQASYSMTRVIPGNHTSEGGPHQDGRIQNSRNDLFATLWIPFNKCGNRLAPALSTLPIRLHNHFPVDSDTTIFARDAFPKELYYEPVFEVGDILLHSTFTMHRSFAKKNMKGKRHSIDLRIF